MNPASFVACLRAGATPDIDACVAALGGRLPLLHELRSTPQDPGWHAEGDVHVHTGMVLEALYRDLEADPLDPSGRTTLILGTLLHDIAKPLTTREAELRGRVRVVAPHHEARGRSWLAPRLGGLGLTFAEQDEVLALVGSHHEPKALVNRDRPEGDWRRVARAVHPDRLARLELADMRGRRCDDWDENVETIELFRMNAGELGVAGWEDQWREELAELGALPETARDKAFGEAIRGAEADRWRTPDGARWLAHTVERVPELVLLCGPSGAGKSSFAATLERQGFAVVSLDELRESLAGARADQSQNGRVRQAAREALKIALRAGRKVVLDATNLRRELRGPLVQLGFDYGALVTLVVFLREPAAWHRQNAARAHAVPADVLDAQIEAFDVPDRHEAHRLVVIGADGVAGTFGTLDGRPPWGI